MRDHTAGVASHTRSIFLPSDFSEASEVAFAHALKMALVSKAPLYVLHVCDRSQTPADWHELPGVRAMLARWRLPQDDTPRSAMRGLGIDVSKVMVHDDNPVTAALGFLASHPADVIVLGVHRRAGRLRWLQRAVGAPVARGSGQMTLYIPHGVEGFVSRASGAVSLSNILVPVETNLSPQAGVDASVRLIRQFGLAAATVTVVHLGASADPVERILAAALDCSADLIVMTAHGRRRAHGVRDTTEEVLSRATCPVASLRAGAGVAHAEIATPVAPGERLSEPTAVETGRLTPVEPLLTLDLTRRVRSRREAVHGESRDGRAGRRSAGWVGVAGSRAAGGYSAAFALDPARALLASAGPLAADASRHGAAGRVATLDGGVR